MVDVPKFTELPGMPSNGPRGCAWAVWNKVHEERTGRKEKDWVGTLNHLTPEVVAAAGKEIKTGERAALNWPLDAYAHVGFDRKKLELNMIDGKEVTKGLFLANDDEISFNTQISSQWDGLCHFGNRPCAVYYNGATHEEMQGGRDRPGSIHEWTKIGGVCGRGVLIDYCAYAEHHGITYSPGERYPISVSAIKAVAAWEGLTFCPGDILLLRTGWTAWHDSLSSDEAQFVAKTRDNHDAAGLEPGEEMAAWLWDNRFAAAAADNPTLEAWPPTGETQLLHEYLLPMLGCPIGELWDLEAVSKLCAKQKQYSFFLASAPINIRGAIATPANAVAVL